MHVILFVKMMHLQALDMDPLKDGPKKQKEMSFPSPHTHPKEYRPWSQADLTSNTAYII